MSGGPRKVYIVVDPEKNILDSFGSLERAEKFRDDWHTTNFIKPIIITLTPK